MTGGMDTAEPRARALGVGDIGVVWVYVVNDGKATFFSELWDVEGAQVGSDSARVPRERHLKARTVTREERASGYVVFECDGVLDLVVGEGAVWAGR